MFQRVLAFVVLLVAIDGRRMALHADDKKAEVNSASVNAEVKAACTYENDNTALTNAEAKENPKCKEMCAYLHRLVKETAKAEGTKKIEIDQGNAATCKDIDAQADGSLSSSSSCCSGGASNPGHKNAGAKAGAKAAPPAEAAAPAEAAN